VANKGIRDFIKDYTVEVLAGITLLVISGVFGTLRLFFPKVLQSIRQGVTTVWGFFLSPVSLPVWVVGVLTILSLLMAGMIVFMVILSRSTKDYDVPKLSEYKEDFIFDVVWRWIN
jgi:hypothetical protein